MIEGVCLKDPDRMMMVWVSRAMDARAGAALTFAL